MYQKDCILRMMEILGDIIAGILGLIRKGDFEQAEDELRLAQGNRSWSLEYSRKSLKLFELIDTEQRLFSRERINKMESIRERIKTMEIS